MMSCEKERSRVELSVMGLVSLQSPGEGVLARRTVTPFSILAGILAVYSMSLKMCRRMPRQ